MEISIWTRRYESIDVIVKFREVEQPLGFVLRPRESGRIEKWLGNKDVSSICKAADIPYDYFYPEISLYHLILLRDKFAAGKTEEQLMELSEFYHCLFCEVLPKVYDEIAEGSRKFLSACEEWQHKLELLSGEGVQHELSVLRDEHSEYLREREKWMKEWEELMADVEKTKSDEN